MERKSSVTRDEPWLTYEQHGQCHMLSPFATKNPCFAVKHDIPHLSGKILLASHHGWFVVADSDDTARLSLFHPFSRATIDLPRLELFSEEINPKTDRARLKFILTCPPDDHNLDTGSCVLMISHKGMLIYCRAGLDDAWQMHRFENETMINCLAIFNGVIYGLVVEDDLRLLKILVSNRGLDSSLVVTIKSVARLTGAKLCNYQSPSLLPTLVELGDHLYCVLVFAGSGEHTNIQDVRVMKFVHYDTTRDNIFSSIDDANKDALDTVDMDNLKNHAIFAGLNCSFACQIQSPHIECISFGLPESLLVQKNCVYLLDIDARTIYVYRLLDRALAAVRIFPNVHIPWDRLLWVKSIAKKRLVMYLQSCIAFNHHSILIIAFYLLTLYIILPFFKYRDQDCKRQSINYDREEEKASVEIQLSELPSELVTLVAKCLTLSDYSNFRVTCKEFCETAPPMPSWLDKRAKIEFSETTRSTSVLPWLLFLTNEGRLCNVIDPIHTNDRYLMTIPSGNSYRGMDAFYSKDGLLLMFGESGNFFFYNPFTKVKTDTKRPTNQLLGYIRSVGCSSLPNSQENCTIVGLYSNPQQLVISSYVYRQDSWLNVSANGVGDTPFIAADNSAVYYKNAFYFLDVTGHLATYRVLPNGWAKCKVMKKPTRPACINSSAHMATYLLECHGELLSVFVGYTNGWVKVFQLDFVRK
ncbi:hypothetical protein RND81_10G101300 [Saponaria officinalis]|uniref:KIB1-4 beta-propeller domain-containing protein n=1 Tax=Saponaria officinalis TaxID=3572 RepID=A0AAW1HZT1_SAPOF